MMSLQFNTDEQAQYVRHFSLAKVGVAGQKKLKAAKVLCIGAGGLGCPLLLYLAASGIGNIGIIDSDCVDVSNLQRQVLFDHDALTKPKATTAKERLLKLNPHIQIESFDQPLNKNNAASLIKQFDLIIDGSDNFATKYLANDVCVQLNKPFLSASIAQFNGQLAFFPAEGGPCYRCLYPSPELLANSATCAENGVLGVLPGIVGSLQALEVCKYFLDLGDSLQGQLLLFDALELSFKKFIISAEPACAVCNKQFNYQHYDYDAIGACKMTIPEISVQELKQMRDNNEDFLLLDVREEDEYETCQIGGKLIPLGELPEKIKELDSAQKIIVHCKSGGRSARAVEFLQTQGFTDVANLQGGILAWISQIDSSLQRY